MNKIFILIFLLLSLNNVIIPANNKMFTTIIQITELKEKEKLILIFANISDCHKCINIPLSTVKSIDISRINNVKFLAVVKCDRDIELKRFRQLFHWKYYTIRDDGNFKKDLNLNKKTIFTIINKKGNILLSYENLKDINKGQIIQVLKKD